MGGEQSKAVLAQTRLADALQEAVELVLPDGRAHVARARREEHGRADAAGDLVEIVGDRLHCAGADARVLRRGTDQSDLVCRVDRALGGNLDAARDLLRRRALLGDREYGDFHG